MMGNSIVHDRGAPGARRLIAYLFLILLMAGLAGCAPGEDGDRQHARKVITQYYDAIKRGDFAAAAALYPQEQQQKWQAFLAREWAPLGRMQSYVIKGVEINTVFSGRIYLFKVTTHNENGDTFDMVTIFKKLNQDGYPIQSHKISRLEED